RSVPASVRSSSSPSTVVGIGVSPFVAVSGGVGRGRSRAVTQAVSEEFAGGVAWQLGDEAEEHRGLVAGQACTAVFDQFFVGDRGTVVDDDVGVTDLAPGGVGYAHHRTVVDGRVCV